MATITRTVDFPYPQEEVFDFVADVTNERLWHPELESVEQTSDGPPGPGSSFRTDYRRLGRMQTTIEEYERPWRLVFRVTGRTRATFECRFSARDGGTRMVTTGETPLRGLAWLLFPLMRGRVQRQFQERGELLRKGLEAKKSAEGARPPQP